MKINKELAKDYENFLNKVNLITLLILIAMFMNFVFDKSNYELYKLTYNLIGQWLMNFLIVSYTINSILWFVKILSDND